MESTKKGPIGTNPKFVCDFLLLYCTTTRAGKYGNREVKKI